MIFNNFCNICFMKENIVKVFLEENEPVFNVLISFTSSRDIVNGIIYLCINCCNKLEEFGKLRELYLTNFVRFRYLYNEHKKQLEVRNAPDIETKLKTFVDVNVERASGTPLIANYEVAQALKNYITSRKLDDELFKVDLDELLNKNSLMQTDTPIPDNNAAENRTQTCHVKYETGSFDEDPENNNGINVEKSEPNSDRFEESHDPLENDAVANIIPCHESDYDISDISTNPEYCATDDSTDEEQPFANENKTTRSDAICNVCEKGFPHTSDLEGHMRTHTDEKHYNCDKCHKTFTDIAKLIRHKRLHSGKRRNICDECGLRFTRRDYLRRHKRTHTGERPYSCVECKKTFIDCGHLIVHKRIHSGEKPYKCDECGLRFTRSCDLTRHKLIHTGERPFSCDECQKTFKQIGNLIEHKRIHSGEKPYKCDECDKAFAYNSTLTSHKRIHSGERPYKCDECGKAFTRKFNLTKHKRIHSGERPYKCEECGSCFNSTSDLVRHARTHTGK